MLSTKDASANGRLWHIKRDGYILYNMKDFAKNTLSKSNVKSYDPWDKCIKCVNGLHITYSCKCILTRTYALKVRYISFRFRSQLLFKISLDRPKVKRIMSETETGHSKTESVLLLAKISVVLDLHLYCHKVRATLTERPWHVPLTHSWWSNHNRI